MSFDPAMKALLETVPGDWLTLLDRNEPPRRTRPRVEVIDSDISDPTGAARLVLEPDAGDERTPSGRLGRMEDGDRSGAASCGGRLSARLGMGLLPRMSSIHPIDLATGELASDGGIRDDRRLWRSMTDKPARQPFGEHGGRAGLFVPAPIR